MASAILYKFQAATTFEALPLPGTSARLIDVKRAIVKAKRLDASTGVEFDLQVRNATNNEEYVDESMLLPRGTRLIVRRLPAARGHGLLQRLARADAGMGTSVGNSGHPSAVPSNFYTIESRHHDENDEFVSTTVSSKTEDEKELAALMAATSQPSAVAGPTMVGGAVGGRSAYRPAGSGPPPQQHRTNHFHSHRPQRNADPELRDFQQQQQVTSKRVTGIPRTFLNLNAPPITEDGTIAGDTHQKIQPNALGLKELVNRGGGQAETTAGTKRDLEYALKLTATTIPEHLQCAICHSVVKDAMLLPWDPEGRTTCETCIRDKLVESGFVCPLTGTEGVSPDDLLPNVGLRKAAEHFIKGVMEKVEAIDQGAVGDDDADAVMDAAAASKALEGDDAENGVIVSRRSISKEGRSKSKNDTDPFGVEDDAFGGDVFGVAPTASNEDKDDDKKEDEATTDASMKTAEEAKKDEDAKETQESSAKQSTESEQDASAPKQPPQRNPEHKPDVPSPESRRDVRKHRSLPVGYSMGPAGGSAVRGRSPPRQVGGRGGGRYFDDGGGRGFRGGGGRGRGGRWHDDRGRDDRGRGFERHNDDYGGGGDERAAKRPRMDDERPPMGGRGGDWHDRHDRPPFHHDRRGPPPPPFRGGRGPRGRGRGGYRGGGGRGYGRGRY